MRKGILKNRHKFAALVIANALAILACATLLGAPQQVTATSNVTAPANLTLTAFFAVAGEDGDGGDETPATPSDGTPAATQDGSLTALPTVGFTPLPTGSTATPDPDSGPGIRSEISAEASYLSPPPAIDGDPGDWEAEEYQAAYVVYGQGLYSGAGDVQATFKVGWDLTYLYVGVVVTDNVFVQAATGNEFYRGDSIEIEIDRDVSGDFDDETMSLDDFQVGLSPGNLPAGGEALAYLWLPQAAAGPLPIALVAAVETPQGYMLEAAIPWTTFGIEPVVRQHYGFALSVNDNDVVGIRSQQTVISNAPERFYSNPTTWADLVLVP
jgi:hypothetical protein